jgi:hypothetical protein
VARAVVPWAARAALAVSVVGIFFLGLYPNLCIGLASLAAVPLP